MASNSLISIQMWNGITGYHNAIAFFSPIFQSKDKMLLSWNFNNSL